MLGRLQRRRAAAGGQAVAKERKVSLMRRYRTGELPDVQQLSVAAFLAPLGKLLILFISPQLSSDISSSSCSLSPCLCLSSSFKILSKQLLLKVSPAFLT